MSSSATDFVFRLGYLELREYLRDAGVEFEPSEGVTALRIRVITYINSLREVDRMHLGGNGSVDTGPVTVGQTILMGRLNSVRVLEVVRPEDVLRFLVAVDQIYLSLSQVDEVLFLTCLLARVQGHAVTILGDVIRTERRYDVFKERLLTHAGPPSVWSEMKQRHVDRFQLPNESVSGYIQTIKSFAYAMNLRRDENKLVGSILEHLSPEARRHRYVSAPPTTFAELRVLGLEIERALQLDRDYYSRVDPRVMSTRRLVSCDTRASVSAVVDTGEASTRFVGNTSGSLPIQAGGRVSSVPTSNFRCSNCVKFGHRTTECSLPKLELGARVCFRCRKPGHLRVSCPEN